jgi:hypothetical protein
VVARLLCLSQVPRRQLCLKTCGNCVYLGQLDRKGPIHCNWLQHCSSSSPLGTSITPLRFTNCSLETWAAELDGLILGRGLSPRLESGELSAHREPLTHQQYPRRAACLHPCGAFLLFLPAQTPHPVPCAVAGASRAEAKAVATAVHWGAPPRDGGYYWGTYKVGGGK